MTHAIRRGFRAMKQWWALRGPGGGATTAGTFGVFLFLPEAAASSDVCFGAGSEACEACDGCGLPRCMATER